MVVQSIMNLPTMQETQVQSLGWEGPLEMGMATHPSSCLENPCGQRRLVGYIPWGHKESDITEPLSLLYMSILQYSKCFLSRRFFNKFER